MRKARVLKVLVWLLAIPALALLVLLFVRRSTEIRFDAGGASAKMENTEPSSSPDQAAASNAELPASPEMPPPAPESPIQTSAPTQPAPLPAAPLSNVSPPPPQPSDDELIEQSLAQLKKGNLAYDTPQKMKTGTTARVTARIGADNISVQTLESGMTPDRGSQIQTESTPVSTRMKMSLKSADFDITPLSSEEQIVGGDTPTEWDWDIAPKHSGTLRLHLAAVVELKDVSRDFATVDRDIAVRVDPINAITTFAAANTVWVLGSLGAGIAALWAWFKRRKKPGPPKWETP
jgi:hypothetical protein